MLDCFSMLFRQTRPCRISSWSPVCIQVQCVWHIASTRRVRKVKIYHV